MSADSINSRIRSFIFQKFPVAKKRSISDDAPLLGSGIIDSLGTLTVVNFLEESFAIKISDEELTPDNFACINSLVRFVELKKGQVGVLAG
jgi:acyl carrier protein